MHGVAEIISDVMRVIVQQQPLIGRASSLSDAVAPPLSAIHATRGVTPPCVPSCAFVVHEGLKKKMWSLVAYCCPTRLPSFCLDT